MLRAIDEHALTPTSLPPDQMPRLFDERPPVMPKVIPDFESMVLEDAKAVDPSTSPADAIMAATNQSLRTVLALMTPAEYHLVHGVDATKEAIRQHRIEQFRRLATIGPVDHVAGWLVEYASELLAHGTSRKRHLADSTIYMYVNHVATAFAELGQQEPLTGWSTLPVAALARIYQAVMTNQSNIRLADYLRYFHEFLMREHGLPNVPFSQQPASDTRRARGPEAELVGRREHLVALQLLDRAIDIHASDTQLQWQLSAARVATILMYHGSLRMGEVVSRVYDDLRTIGTTFVLHVHDTVFGTLKTRSAERVVVMDTTLVDHERATLTSWLRAARVPNKTRHPEPLSPLFPESPGTPTAMSRRVMEDLIGRALRLAVDRPTARPHWLRHAAASETFLRAMSRTPGTGAHARLLRRSDIIQVQALLGHASISTTLASYIHTDALVPRGSPVCLSDHRGIDLASLAGITHDHWRRKRAALAKTCRSPDEWLAFILGMRRFRRKGSAP